MADLIQELKKALDPVTYQSKVRQCLEANTEYLSDIQTQIDELEIRLQNFLLPPKEESVSGGSPPDPLALDGITACVITESTQLRGIVIRLKRVLERLDL